MAIQPRFAQAILDDRKDVEFRKRGLAPDVDTVLIYESSPTQRLVGQFTVARVVEESPERLWRLFGSRGAIGHDEFMTYYGSTTTAFGLVVGQRCRFTHPVALADLTPSPAIPQSYAYLHASVLDQIEALQPQTLEVAVRRRIGQLVGLPRRRLAGAGTAP